VLRLNRFAIFRHLVENFYQSAVCSSMIPRYSLLELDSIWLEENKYNTWFLIELAACEACEVTGVIPGGTSQKIRQAFDELTPLKSSDILKIKELEEATRHDFVAFLQYIGSKTPEARWLHYGLTSSDVVDTSFSLMMTASHRVISSYLQRLVCSLESRIREFSHNVPVMIGRTHGMHAEPITFALVLARHLAEFKRNQVRLENTMADLAVGKLSGAVGTYAHFSQEAEYAALKSLGLSPAIDSTQVIARDRYAAFFLELSLIAVAIERMATTFRHLQRSEVGEVCEGFAASQKGSSAMPHKRNPILSENLCGLSRYVRGMVTPVIENCVLWHERDISHSSVERFIAPDITSVVGFMLYRTTKLVDNIVLNRDTMLENLDKNNWYSESILLSLISAGMSRTQAHGVVQRAANNFNGQEFIEMVLNDPYVKNLKLDENDIMDKCSIEYATRNVNNIIKSIMSY
jgi:adenylosuccinate lyase